jgi:hypothetical protein
MSNLQPRSVAIAWTPHGGSAKPTRLA